MMQDVVAIIEKTDGSIAITQLAPNHIRERLIRHFIGKFDERYLRSVDDAELRSLMTAPQFELFLDALLLEVKRKLGDDYLSVARIERKDLPKDRTFRNAWGKDGKKITVRMDKARELHMNRIRKARDKRLTELDKRKYGAEFDQERQALRDLPQTFDLTQAATPDELKALWPAALEKEN